MELRLVEPEDEMTDDELDRLDEALARGFEEVASGQLREATEVVDALREPRLRRDTPRQRRRPLRVAAR